MKINSWYQNGGEANPKSNIHLRIIGFHYLKPQHYQTLSLKITPILKFHVSFSSMDSEFSLSRGLWLSLDAPYIDHPNTPSSHYQYHYRQFSTLPKAGWVGLLDFQCCHHFSEGLTIWHFLNKWQILKQNGQMISEPPRYQSKNLLPYKFLWQLSLFLKGIVPAWLKWHSLRYSAKSECHQFLYLWVTPVRLCW